MTNGASEEGSAVETDPLGIVGKRLPEVTLPTASGKVISFSRESDRWVVLFCYPGDGLGEKHPHLRGCTAEALGFREAFKEIVAAGARLYGVSAQPSPHQAKFHKSARLNYELLSDKNLKLANALGLPIDEVDGATVLLRLTIVADTSRVVRRVFFPVHDPAAHPREVLGFLKAATGRATPAAEDPESVERL
jgi:peroxiredoxin